MCCSLLLNVFDLEGEGWVPANNGHYLKGHEPSFLFFFFHKL